MQENKEYSTPELIVYGNIEELTEGPGPGCVDSLVGATGNGIWIDKPFCDHFGIGGGSGS